MRKRYSFNDRKVEAGTTLEVPEEHLSMIREYLGRSTVAFLLGLTFFASAIIQAVFGLLAPPPTAPSIDFSKASMLFDLTLGILVLIYWVHDRPDYTGPEPPLGITLLGIQLVISTLIIVGATILFSRSATSVSGAVIGLAIGHLVRALWKGKDWALTVMKFLTVIGLIAAPILLFVFRVGNPIFPIFQFWYLTRPHVSKFFGQTDFNELTTHQD